MASMRRRSRRSIWTTITFTIHDPTIITATMACRIILMIRMRFTLAMIIMMIMIMCIITRVTLEHSEGHLRNMCAQWPIQQTFGAEEIEVLDAFLASGNARNLIALDLDSSDNLSDEALQKFLSRHGHQLLGLSLSGMPHITDQLWMNVLKILTNTKILIMGTIERLGVNIHVDQLMDAIATHCQNLERIELRWDPLNLRFSDKSQKAIDIIRVKCLKLKSLVLSDGRYYEIVKANFERADRLTVVRTYTSCRVSLYYLLSNYKDLIFN
ncbi:hypothetical protein M8J76_012276 [Diaphorina citri]|nr:hypothetical protein M8J76_012276 [Diaphorina citri]